jgi:hypothetical protein
MTLNTTITLYRSMWEFSQFLFKKSFYLREWESRKTELQRGYQTEMICLEYVRAVMPSWGVWRPRERAVTLFVGAAPAQ